MNNDAAGTTSVAVVGPGRVGTVLAAALQRAGHDIVAAGGGASTSRERFARRFPRAVTVEEPSAAAESAELVIVATPDDTLPDVLDALAAHVRADQRVVHVAGAFGLQPLAPVTATGARAAACHPAQTIPSADADPEVLVGAAWAVTATGKNRGWARELVTQIGGVAFDVPDKQRVRYHAGLVIGSNAAGAVALVAAELLAAAGIDEPSLFLHPLVTTSLTNALVDGPSALTGPVARGDARTVEAHLADLSRLDALAADYRRLQQVVLARLAEQLPADSRRAIAQLLADPEEP